MVGYLYNGVIASYSSLCVIFMPHICQKANFKHALKLTDNPELSVSILTDNQVLSIGKIIYSDI